MSKQAYYKSTDQTFARLAHESFIVEYVHQIRTEAPVIGGEKLWLMYKGYFREQCLGRDAFLGVLRRHNLLLRKPRRGCRTTDSSHNLPLYPDLVKDLLLTGVHRVWVSDITYILTAMGFCFLSVVTDAYTHQIIGWCVGPTLEAIYPLEAVKMAYRSQAECQGELIHHSDRGCQYASLLYTSYLKKKGIRISMTQSGNPKDNAIAERINGILKTEFLNHHDLRDIDHVREILDRAILFYNTQRPHRSLDMMTPLQAQQKKGEIKKRWISYKDPYRKSTL